MLNMFALHTNKSQISGELKSVSYDTYEKQFCSKPYYLTKLRSSYLINFFVEKSLTTLGKNLVSTGNFLVLMYHNFD